VGKVALAPETFGSMPPMSGFDQKLNQFVIWPVNLAYNSEV